MDRSGLFCYHAEIKKSVSLTLFSSIALSRLFELSGRLLNNFHFLVVSILNNILRKKKFHEHCIIYFKFCHPRDSVENVR